jgi:anti-sigma regulatory factor (Ser/Thr protein kinase)
VDVSHSSNPTSLHLTVSPAASALAATRARVRTFLRGSDVPEHVVFDVVLTLDEACKNAIRFSGSARKIDITVALDVNGVCLVVRDHGVGFEPHEIDVSTPPDLLEPRGRGLFLMACLMDDLRIGRDRGAIVTARRTVAR